MLNMTKSLYLDLSGLNLRHLAEKRGLATFGVYVLADLLAQ
jgi:hypothetical protein